MDRGPASVIDQNIKAAEAGSDFIDNALNTISGSQVSGKPRYAGIESRRFAQSFFRACHDKNISALYGKLPGNFPADTRTSSRDQNLFVIELQIHLSLLLGTLCEVIFANSFGICGVVYRGANWPGTSISNYIRLKRYEEVRKKLMQH